jgi:hypothetical protein
VVSVGTSLGQAHIPSTPLDRRLLSDSGLHARHKAAMKIVKRGIEDDPELLLSYVVWPTELIEVKLEQAARSGLVIRTHLWR